MSTIKELHQSAMEQTDLALAARRSGSEEEARALFNAAFDFELQAAQMIAPNLHAEPTRSILHRSAATLALDCGQNREAEILICEALRGQPPEEIAEELRDLWEQISFRRHLELRGVFLAESEFQMSIWGKAIGLGIAPVSEFIPRVSDAERLVYRSAERLSGLPFRTTSRVPPLIRNSVEVFNTVPRTASFAVSFRIGHSTQLSIPGNTSLSEETIDDVLECLELFNNGDKDKLTRKIPQEDYYINFTALARKIGPDGEDVSLVGFSAIRKGELKTVALTRGGLGAAEIAPVFGLAALRSSPKAEPPVTVQGFLKEADSRDSKKGKIHVVDAQGTSHAIIVPLSMMSDIVKPLWESEVIIVADRKKKVLHLTDIRPARGL